jgi:hypothetical protein
MRPLADLDRGALCATEGLVFDVDDTLTTRGRLTAEAYRSLCRLADAGLRLVAVTGRPLGWTDGMASSWPVDLAVGENGAGWAYRDGRGLRTGYFHDSATRREHEATLRAIRAAVAEAHPTIRLASDQEARRCDLAFDVGEQASMSGTAIAELVDTIERGGVRALVSSVHAHAVPGAWDKAEGVRRALSEALGRDLDAELERWVFVGDSGNDAAAFAAFEHTVGVANVAEHLDRLPVAPRWVTRSPRGEGFTELAGALLEARAG